MVSKHFQIRVWDFLHHSHGCFLLLLLLSFPSCVLMREFTELFPGEHRYCLFSNQLKTILRYSTILHFLKLSIVQLLLQLFSRKQIKKTAPCDHPPHTATHTLYSPLSSLPQYILSTGVEAPSVKCKVTKSVFALHFTIQIQPEIFYCSLDKQNIKISESLLMSFSKFLAFSYIFTTVFYLTNTTTTAVY